MMRLLFAFGTRPEAIKLFPLIHAARDLPGWAALVCATGQHRQMLDQVLEVAGVVPDVDLRLMKPAQDLAHVTAAVLRGVTEAIRDLKPDMVVVQGDTTTAMAGALAGFYEKVPVVHVEAGLRSGSLTQPWPEEANRKIIAQIADWHFAPTRRAADNLAQEGLPAERIFVTGNTGIDALTWIAGRFEAEGDFVDEVMGGLPALDPARRLVLVTAHRRENHDGGIAQIARALRRLAARGDVQIVFPVHLNPKVTEPVHQILGDCDGVHLLPPLDYLPFAWLMSRADLIITDSGGVQEEALTFGAPVLVTRETTERPEGVDAGGARIIGFDEQRIVDEAARLLDDAQAYALMSGVPNPYGDGRASARILSKLGGRDTPEWA